MSADTRLTVAKLERALTDCAGLVDRLGEKALPLYEIIERALDKARAKEAVMARVRSRLTPNQSGAQNGAQNGTHAS